MPHQTDGLVHGSEPCEESKEAFPPSLRRTLYRLLVQIKRWNNTFLKMN